MKSVVEEHTLKPSSMSLKTIMGFVNCTQGSTFMQIMRLIQEQ